MTVNLAVALAARGHDVGLLDADVYGFSVPKMLGVTQGPVAIDDLLVPPVVHGVRCLSMGFFVPDEQPVIWRGPMLHKALEQFLVDSYWGEPDFLLIDMPPGTGDVTLSLGQYLPRTEIVVVTTPQAGGPACRPALGLRGEEAQAGRAGRRREHVVVHRRRRHALRAVRRRRRPGARRRPRGPALGPGPARSRPPGGRRHRSAGGVWTPPVRLPCAFDALATRLEELGPARIYRRELNVR